MGVCYFILGLLDQPSGLEGYGRGAIYFLILLVSLLLSMVFLVIAIWQQERPIWAYFTLIILMTIPVLGSFTTHPLIKI